MPRKEYLQKKRRVEAEESATKVLVEGVVFNTRGANPYFFRGGVRSRDRVFIRGRDRIFVRGRDHKNFHLYPSPTFKVLTTPLAAV